MSSCCWSRLGDCKRSGMGVGARSLVGDGFEAYGFCLRFFLLRRKIIAAAMRKETPPMHVESVQGQPV
jgi:hypothetical protein